MYVSHYFLAVHAGWFDFLAAVSNAAKNTDVQKSDSEIDWVHRVQMEYGAQSKTVCLECASSGLDTTKLPAG